MSPSRWRALRALRVVLACLALWLPAPAASAAVGPVDAVVMMAGAAPGVEASSVDGGRPRARAHANAVSLHTASVAVALRGGEHFTVRAQKTPRCASSVAIYLLHCALLR